MSPTVKQRSSARSELVALLRDHGLRVTPQRMSIVEAIAAGPDHFSAESIHAAMADEHPRINFSTVYRTLETFESRHLVRRTDLGPGRVVYHWTGRSEPHHHLVCHDCGAVIECDEADLAPLVQALGQRYGFHADLAHQSIFGHCNQCRHAADSPAAPVARAET